MDALPKSFKERRTFGQRVREVEQVRKEYPDKVPVIIERYAHENQLPPLDRSKFLIPEHVHVGELIKILRRRLQLNSSQSIFLIVNGRNLPANASTFSEIYRNEADPDGFLYIVYASHETFGCSSSAAAANAAAAADASHCEQFIKDIYPHHHSSSN